MRNAAMRIGLIRLGLLIVLTAALVSLVFRIDVRSTSNTTASRAGGPASRMSPPTSPAPAASTPMTSSPSPAPSAGVLATASTGTAPGGDTSTGSSDAQLPLTGGAQPWRLTAVGLVLVGAGGLMIGAVGPRRHQPAADTVHD